MAQYLPNYAQPGAKVGIEDGDPTQKPDPTDTPPPDNSAPPDGGGPPAPWPTTYTGPPINGGPDTTTGAPTDGSGMPSWLTSIFGDGSNGGLFGGQGMNALTMAGLAAALQQWHNAGQYRDTANTAAGVANPMGSRQYYVDQLKQSYTDPTAFLNEPGNQAAVKLALQSTGAADAAQGYLGSGRMMQDLNDHAELQNETYLNQIRQQLGQAAGVQFDPQNAAADLMKGNDQMIQSQNGALSALMMPFMAQMSQNNINNTRTTTPGGGAPNPANSVANIARGLNADGSPLTIAGPASQWIQDQIRAGHTVDPNDPHVAQAVAEANASQPTGNENPPDNPYGQNPNIPSPPPTDGGSDMPNFLNPDGSWNQSIWTGYLQQNGIPVDASGGIDWGSLFGQGGDNL